MFIPLWIIAGIFSILTWSIWLNFQRTKQIRALQYSFITISDLSINKLTEIKSEREQYESDPELVPFVIIESLQEIENTVDSLLKRQTHAGVQPYQLKDGARELGIV